MADEQLPLFEFEVIDAAEFAKSKAKTSSPRKVKHDLGDRSYVVWYSLPSYMGICTVPMHDEIIRSLNPEQQAYRQRHEPNRFVFEIGDHTVCRDCFIAKADLE